MQISEHKNNSNLDSIMILSFSVMILLLITGGLNIVHPKIKLDLAQLDTFSWIFFILALIRKKTIGSFFPERILSILELLKEKLKNSKFITAFSVIYSFLFFWLISWRFQSFNANAYDLSYILQPIWSTLNVSFLHSSLSINNTYLGEHFAPVLAIFSPLFILLSSPYTLFLITCLIILLNVYLIKILAESFNLKPEVKNLIILTFLLYQPFRAALIFDFREDHLFIPVFLTVLYFLRTKRILLLWTFLCFSFFIKENASIFTALIGLWIIVDAVSLKKIGIKKHHGFLIFIVSCLVFYIVNTKLTPYFSGTTQKTRFAFRMGSFGNTTSEFLMYILSNPFTFFKFLTSQLINKSTFKYFLVVFLPFIVCFRYSPIAFTIALFGFLLNVILGIQSIGFHYECIFIPFLFYSLIETLSKKSLSTSTFGFILIGFFLFFGRSPIHFIKEFKPTQHDQFVVSELRKVPQEASISTTTAIHPHLTLRKDAFLFSGEPKTDYVITDTHPNRNLYGTPNLESDISQMSKYPYELIVNQDYFKVWKKKN